VKSMCHVLAVSESGYYAWRKREPSQRQRENEQLTEQIRCAYERRRQVYGSPRVQAELHAQGIDCGKHRAARLMRQASLRAGKSTPPHPYHREPAQRSDCAQPTRTGFHGPCS